MDKFKPGNIMFVEGHSLLDRTIEYFDKGRFSHVCMIIDEGVVLESQYIVNTVIRKCEYSPQNYDIVDIGLTEEQRRKILPLGMDALRYYDNYDMKQLFYQGYMDFLGLHGKNKWNSPKHPICSELMVHILEQLKWFDNEDQKKYILDSTPNSLYKLLKYQLNHKSA